MKKLHRVLLATGAFSLAAAMAQASPDATDMGTGNAGTAGSPNDMGSSRDRNANPDLSGFAGCPSGDTECMRNRRNRSDTDNRTSPSDSGTWNSNRDSNTGTGTYGGGTMAPDTSSGTRTP